MLELSIGILLPVLSLIGFIVFVIVLIKQFQHGGALQGILGIITCGLWTFIWGWIKHRSLAMTKLMIIWTILQVTPKKSDVLEMEFVFNLPLESPSLVLIYWDGKRYQCWKPTDEWQLLNSTVSPYSF